MKAQTETKARAVKVVQDVEAEIPVEVMAKAVETIAKAMQTIARTRVTQKMIILLIHDQTKLPKYQIENVLNSLEGLERLYLKPKGKH